MPSQVPLTQSLYVPGRVVEPDKMLVDVGTGYYVEKDQQKTVEFLERKVRYASGMYSPLQNTRSTMTVIVMSRPKLGGLSFSPLMPT